MKNDIPRINEEYSEELKDFIAWILNRDSEKRPSIKQIVECPFF